MSESACQSCGAPVTPGTRTCEACGAATVRVPDDSTQVVPDGDTPKPSPPKLDEPPPADRAKPSKGPNLQGYEIIKVMGAGGMGEVYLAKEETLHRLVAIKTILTTHQDAAAHARFAREARSMAMLEHPNVARVYSFGALEDGTPYLIMEFVDGVSLRDRLGEKKQLPVAEALAITRQVVQALSAAWEKKIIHRDIKPGNILINRQEQVRVVDFGLAKAIEVSADGVDMSLTQEGYLVGTPRYMSPEQARSQKLTCATDIYSLGIVLFEMLVGTRPFHGSNPLALVTRHLNEPLPSIRERRPEVPLRVERLAEWMAAKDPAERPSYDQILDEIDAIIGPSTRETPVAGDINERWERIRDVGERATISALLFFSMAMILVTTVLPGLWPRLAAFPETLSKGLLAAGAFVVAGIAVSAGWALVGWYRRIDHRPQRLALAFSPLALAAVLVLVTTSNWFLEAMSDVPEATNRLFTFGPYPDDATLQRLDSEGYSGVISLLDPALFPVETMLAAREAGRVEELGLHFEQVPMRPWVSTDDRAIEALERVLLERPGQYYVHGYVDRHRPAVVNAVIEDLMARQADQRLYQPPLTVLERGEIRVLGNGKYFIPFPTEEEMLAFILGGGIREVVSILHPDVGDNAALFQTEAAFLQLNGIGLRSFPLGTLDHDPFRALDAANYVRNAAPPVAVHGFYVPDQNPDPASEAFLGAYFGGRPALAPSLFTTPLENGPVTVVAPHVAVGPPPEGREFGGYLRRRGIQEFVYVGSVNDDRAVQDGRLASEHGLRFSVLDPLVDPVLQFVNANGPFYLYGPRLEAVQAQIAERYGPAVPWSEPRGSAHRREETPEP